MERPSASATKARFFVEEHPEVLGGEPRSQVLTRLLNPETCSFLEQHGWGISLAMIDVSAESAAIVGQINKDFPNLPITAWIVVDDKEGYWTNRYNIVATRRKVEEVKAWANRFDLRF